MHRVKRVDYDGDDLYSEEEDYGEEGGAGEGTSAEDQENFAILTPVVRAELEEAGLQASDKEIQDALWHYYWDVGKSVSYLKNARTPRPQQEKQQESVKKPKSKFDQAAEKSAQKSGHTTATSSPANGLVKKTEALKLDASASSPSQSKIKNKGLDVPALWMSEKDTTKSSTAFVVIGHVDHGKSTLMGRLLLDTGAVSQRDVDKYKKQATELGKSSFALAWVMDTGSDERERGVTVDIAQHHFATDKVEFTILDAPGHRDFIPNMIGGASMADLAVLVVDANQLESGIKGQTREHILLARACGLKKVVVAVNKLDSTNPAWDETTFKDTVLEISKLLHKTGFAPEDISFVPCSGLSGQNVVQALDTPSWIAKASPPLLQVLEGLTTSKPTEDTIRQPLRMQIADVYRGGITNPLSISGRLVAGNVQIGDAASVQPSGEIATVRGIEIGGEGRDCAVAGQLCSLHLTEIEPQHLRAGDVLCSAAKPVAVVEGFVVRVHALAALLPQGVDLHLGRLHSPGSIVQLVALYNEKGELLKKRPRVVKEGQMASVKIKLESSAPLAVEDRVILRVTGSTIAAGRIESIST